jgi:nucleotide-binding universal stress UspA family protein
MNASARNTVLVGVDGTKDGDRAVRYGTALASRADLDLRLVHVAQEVSLLAPMMPYLSDDTMREIGESVLQKAVTLAEEAGFDAGRIGTLLAEGPRTPALLGRVEDAEHIVLGTRTSAVQHLLTGATSLSVVAHSPVPVHCVPRGWSDDRDLSGRLVVGVDGSEVDRDILQEAFVEASMRGAALEIVHAWHPVSPYDVTMTGRVLRDDWDKNAREALTRRIEPVAATHADVEWTLRLEFERVPVALHEAAANADLLIIGRHGHRGRFALLVGSNARTLVHNATCPVVVVPDSSDEH